MTATLAVTGDAIINRRVSALEDPAVESLVEPIRAADVGVTHLETLIHDYDGPGVHPAAEAGGTWMRSPGFVVEELRWLGVDLVSHASNHALDYGYGALRSTWDALDAAGVPHAGTGEDLADARSATYLDTPIGRVGLVSMTTSFAPWSRAGEARYDHRGRPGLNPLGFHHAVGADTLETLKTTAKQLGRWVTEFDDGEWAIHPPGLHNSITRFYEADDVDGARMVVDDRDREGNLRAIRNAAGQADFVVAHLHTHAWDPDGTLADPPDFVRAFARDCVDAGADCFLGQGSHAPLRPIELYENKPIFHDPGDLLLTNGTVDRLPAEFYARFEHNLDVDHRLATPAEGQAARPTGYESAETPPGGYMGTPFGRRLVVPVCDFDDEYRLERITLHPGRLHDEPMGYQGVPTRLTDEDAAEVVGHVRDLSAPYGVDVRLEDDIGVVEP